MNSRVSHSSTSCQTREQDHSKDHKIPVQGIRRTSSSSTVPRLALMTEGRTPAPTLHGSSSNFASPVNKWLAPPIQQHLVPRSSTSLNRIRRLRKKSADLKFVENPDGQFVLLSDSESEINAASTRKTDLPSSSNSTSVNHAKQSVGAPSASRPQSVGKPDFLHPALSSSDDSNPGNPSGMPLDPCQPCDQKANIKDISSTDPSTHILPAASSRPPKRKQIGTLDNFVTSKPKRPDLKLSPKRGRAINAGSSQLHSNSEDSTRKSLKLNDPFDVIDLTEEDPEEPELASQTIPKPLRPTERLKKSVPGSFSAHRPALEKATKPLIDKGEGREVPVSLYQAESAGSSLPTHTSALDLITVSKGKRRENPLSQPIQPRFPLPGHSDLVVKSTRSQFQDTQQRTKSGIRPRRSPVSTVPGTSVHSTNTSAAHTSTSRKHAINSTEAKTPAEIVGLRSVLDYNHISVTQGYESDEGSKLQGVPFQVSPLRSRPKSSGQSTWLDSLKISLAKEPAFADQRARRPASEQQEEPSKQFSDMNTIPQGEAVVRKVSQGVSSITLKDGNRRPRSRQTARKSTCRLVSRTSINLENGNEPPRSLQTARKSAWNLPSINLEDGNEPPRSLQTARKSAWNLPSINLEDGNGPQLSRQTARKSAWTLPSRRSVSKAASTKGKDKAASDRDSDFSSSAHSDAYASGSSLLRASDKRAREAARNNSPKDRPRRAPPSRSRQPAATSSSQDIVPSSSPSGSRLRAEFEANIRKNTPEDEAAPRIEIVNNYDDEPCPPSDFTYSNELRCHPDVPQPTKRSLVGCDCEPRCDPKRKQCECLLRHQDYLSVIENTKEFVYDAKGRVKRFDLPIFECNDRCGCDDTCRNRVVQNGRKCEISIGKTLDKGWGIFAGAKKIPGGTFLGIYAGEILPEALAEQRGLTYDRTGRTYLFDIDFYHLRPKPGEKGAKDWAPTYVVDAGKMGNFTRYFNHSCAPNAVPLPCYINDGNLNKPTIAFFASYDIEPFHEICFSYHGDEDDDEDSHSVSMSNKKVASYIRCLCGASNCRGKMFA